MNAKLLPAFLALLTRMSLAFRDPRPRAKVERLALGLLCAEGPKTITSALGWLEQRYEDWSGEYCRRRLKVDDFGRNEKGWTGGKKKADGSCPSA